MLFRPCVCFFFFSLAVCVCLFPLFLSQSVFVVSVSASSDRLCLRLFSRCLSPTLLAVSYVLVLSLPLSPRLLLFSLFPRLFLSPYSIARFVFFHCPLLRFFFFFIPGRGLRARVFMIISMSIHKKNKNEKKKSLLRLVMH